MLISRPAACTAACLTGVALLAASAHAQCTGWLPLPNPADANAALSGSRFASVDLDGRSPRPELLVSLGVFCLRQGTSESDCGRIHVFENGVWQLLGSTTRRPGQSDFGAQRVVAFRGELVIAGGFGTIAGIPARAIAALRNGTWTELGGGCEGRIRDMIVWQNQLIVAGEFTQIGGVRSTGVAAWDGQSWRDLAALPQGSGYNAVVVRGTQLIAIPSTPYPGWTVQAFDGTAWTPFSTPCPAGGAVSAQFIGDDLYIAREYHADGNMLKFSDGQWRSWCVSMCPSNGFSAIRTLTPFDFDRDGALDLLAFGEDSYPMARPPRTQQFLARIQPPSDIVFGVLPPPGGLLVGPMTVHAGELVVYAWRYINGFPYVFAQPTNTTACGRRDAAFSTTITNTLTEPTYRWQRNGIPLTDGPTPWGSTILGSESPQLTIRSPRPQDLGTYRCIITNNTCGSAQTRDATLTGCQADINCDSQADFADYLDFIDNFANETPAADFDANGTVDFFDYLDFVEALAGGC